MFALWWLCACTHTPAKPVADPAAIRSAAEKFHQRVRWKDYRGASDLLVADRRQSFVDERESLNDERDLTVADYDLTDVRLDDASGDRAWVISRISWVRLPSITEQTQTVTTELVRVRDQVWLIARQDRGPFTGTLGAPYPPASP
ncbi:MAG TPA: hypothetical protein VFV33_02260 [Gemmatimonadaceae bacterium]|nr:hypothetical protein [Gemmatimonadaceae bacterium]